MAKFSTYIIIAISLCIIVGISSCASKSSYPFSITYNKSYTHERASSPTIRPVEPKNENAISNFSVKPKRNKYNIDIDELDIPVNDTYIQGVEQTGAVILNPSKWLNGVTIQTNDINVINAINALPYVENTMKFIDGEVKQVIKEDIENIFYDIPVNNEELDDYYEYALHKKKNKKRKEMLS